MARLHCLSRGAEQYLFLWRGAEFAGLAGCFCGTHCEGQHELIISMSLISLHLVDKHV